jgi:glycosyltransferase involved in cell wall biosynthesis
LGYKHKIDINKKLFIILIFFIIKIKDKFFFEYYISHLNLKKGNQKIKIGILAHSIKNGGCERQTALLLNYLYKVKRFELILITNKTKEESEYYINDNIKRIIKKNNLILLLKQENIDILIYQFYNLKEINELNKLKGIKTIFINRSCFLHWIYYNSYAFLRELYLAYKKASYVISLIPFENNYLFKKWGINSILMNNFIAYDYKSIVPSDLSSKTILMIGRANDKIKRFDLGIKSMKYIVEELPECEMKIISETLDIQNLKELIYELKLEKHIIFVGYNSDPHEYYKNASLHLFPTLAEAFPNVLSETLIYGIPNILAGLDYVSTSKGGGSIIVYDDSPLSIAKIAVKILKDNKYRKKLGKEARKNMKKYNNYLLFRKWVKLIVSVYNDRFFYKKLKRKKIEEQHSIQIIEAQIKLLKLREKKFQNITINPMFSILLMFI